MTTFQVSTRWSGHRRVVRVFVYDSKKEMHAAANAYQKKNGIDDPIAHGTYGLCHRFTHRNIDTDEVSCQEVAIIRLIKNWCRTGVIAHEVTHAALHIYWTDIDSRGVAEDDIDNDEVFSYMIGDLTSKIVNKLYEYKVI